MELGNPFGGEYMDAVVDNLADLRDGIRPLVEMLTELDTELDHRNRKSEPHPDRPGKWRRRDPAPASAPLIVVFDNLKVEPLEWIPGSAVMRVCSISEREDIQVAAWVAVPPNARLPPPLIKYAKQVNDLLGGAR